MFVWSWDKKLFFIEQKLNRNGKTEWKTKFLFAASLGFRRESYQLNAADQMYWITINIYKSMGHIDKTEKHQQCPQRGDYTGAH